MPAKRKATPQKAKSANAPGVIEYGSHGVDKDEVVDDAGAVREQAEVAGPFEIEVGSAAWERLAEEGKLGPEAEREAAARKEEQDAQDSELVE